jgi:predicted transcriptional regulator
MILDQFKHLGFSENEMSVYLLLAEVGRSSASMLAKRAGIVRTTAYSVLENLVRKGLVSEEESQGKTYFVANPVSSLVRGVEKEREELRVKEKIAKELAATIEPYFRSANFSIPKFQFFDGQANVNNFLYENTSRWSESVAKYDHTWWGYQDHTFVENYLEWLEYYWSVKPQEEKIQLVSNKVKIEAGLKGKVPGREIKPAPIEYNFSSSIWVNGDYIVLLMTKQDPHYAYQMIDPVFAANLRLIFKLLWSNIR